MFFETQCIYCIDLLLWHLASLLFDYIWNYMVSWKFTWSIFPPRLAKRLLPRFSMEHLLQGLNGVNAAEYVSVCSAEELRRIRETSTFGKGSKPANTKTYSGSNCEGFATEKHESSAFPPLDLSSNLCTTGWFAGHTEDLEVNSEERLPNFYISENLSW